MDRAIDLAAVLQREVEDYARGETWKAITYPISDVTRQIYTVLVIPYSPRKQHAGIIVAARIVDDKIYIDEDITDRPLVHELVRAGIPREQIICTYTGKPLPEQEDQPPVSE